MQSHLHAPGEATHALAQLDVQAKRSKVKGKHLREAQQLVHLAENIGALLRTLDLPETPMPTGEDEPDQAYATQMRTPMSAGKCDTSLPEWAGGMLNL